MKKLTTLLSFILLNTVVYSQSTIYFNFVTHNEETQQWNNTNYYTTNRLRLVALSNYFQQNGITWNMQSDWVYLTNVLTQETPALTATTNNKNILQYIQADKGVEMDPHAHESQYIYPDELSGKVAVSPEMLTTPCMSVFCTMDCVVPSSLKVTCGVEFTVSPELLLLLLLLLLLFGAGLSSLSFLQPAISVIPKRKQMICFFMRIIYFFVVRI